MIYRYFSKDKTLSLVNSSFIYQDIYISNIFRSFSKIYYKEIDKIENLKPPEYPDNCCGQGCKICVFDEYFDLLDEYEQRKQELLKYKNNLNLNDNFSNEKTMISESDKMLRRIRKK